MINSNLQNLNDTYIVGHYNQNKEFILNSTHSSIESATIAWHQTCEANAGVVVEIRKITHSAEDLVTSNV